MKYCLDCGHTSITTACGNPSCACDNMDTCKNCGSAHIGVKDGTDQGSSRANLPLAPDMGRDDG